MALQTDTLSRLWLMICWERGPLIGNGALVMISLTPDHSIVHQRLILKRGHATVACPLFSISRFPLSNGVTPLDSGK
jgi:hypothetical protein